jgi:hypothetical protein
VIVRTTLHLDERLFYRLRRLVPPSDINRFINQSIEDKVSEMERAAAEAMKEGYLRTRRNRDRLNADWQAVDTEGWPE